MPSYPSATSLTATASATLTKAQTDTQAQFQLSGTYGTVTFVFEGTKDGTNFFPLAAIDTGTGLVVTGTISPADNAIKNYKIPAEGLSTVRARVTAIASGTVTFTPSSDSFLGHQTIPISTSANLVTGQITEIWMFPINLASITTTQDVVTNYTPGFAGKIVGIDFLVNIPVTTGSKLATLNMEIGTTDLTGGTVALTSALATPMGKVIAGAAITANNVFSSTDTVSVEAASVTAFVEGSGTLLVKVQNYTA